MHGTIRLITASYNNPGRNLRHTGMKKIHYTDNYLLKPYHPVTIHVAGAGGTGSQVITNLARMNVALQALGHPGLHVTVFDPDIITEANIGRQLFSEMELGQGKATAAVTRVNRFFGTTWTAENCRYPVRKTQENGDDRTKPANIIITCTDNTRSRLELWRFLKKYRETSVNNERAVYYWMDFGMRKPPASLHRYCPQQDTAAGIKRIHAGTRNERHHRGGELFHNRREGLRTELLTGGSTGKTGPVHQLHTGTSRL